jgi:hypothetical protein
LVLNPKDFRTSGGLDSPGTTPDGSVGILTKKPGLAKHGVVVLRG